MKQLTKSVQRGLAWIEGHAWADFESQDSDIEPQLRGREREDVLNAFNYIHALRTRAAMKEARK